MGQVIAILFVIVAVVMSIIGSTIPLDKMHNFILVMRFFENMIPVLAVGALLKYLMCSHMHAHWHKLCKNTNCTDPTHNHVPNHIHNVNPNIPK